jgi:archaemetzincin
VAKYFVVLWLAFILTGCINDPREKVIAIQPIDKFDQTLMDSIAPTLNKVYGLRVIQLPRQQMPRAAFVNIKTPRYRADKLIQLSREEKPDSLDYILTLTDHDISTTVKDSFGRTQEPESKYEDWGVFGLGYRPGPTCVVSTFRLKPKVDQKKLIDRLRKVCAHEIGHNLGLEHCTSRACVMRDAAEKISTVDQEALNLCNQCRKALEW